MNDCLVEVSTCLSVGNAADWEHRMGLQNMQSAWFLYYTLLFLSHILHIQVS